jgi:hypothetical protein
MKRMKRCIVLLSFMLFLFGCKGNTSNNLPQNNGNEGKDVELSFSDKISCNKGIVSGDLIEDGTELMFTFIGKLEEGQDIKEWKLNGEKIKDSENAKKIKLKIDVKKAKKENNKKVISIEVALENPSFSIQFDEEKITANGMHGNNSIAKGYKAKKGEQIKFVLKDESIKVENWKINGNVASEESKFLYTVKKEDADGEGNILVTYTEKLETYTLKFQEEKIKVEKMPENKEVLPLHKIKVGETYKFSIKNANENVEYWTCNGDKIAESAKNELLYTVKKGDGSKDASLEIAYKVLEAEKLVITFGADIEKCEITSLLSNTDVKSGDTVKIGTELKITANLLQGEEIEKWIIGKKESATKDKVIRYKTKLEDAENGVINVKFEKKTLDWATISYNPILMDCVNYENNEKIDVSSKVFRGMKLKFTANLESGFDLINWAINGIAKTNERREVFIYTVDIVDAKGENKEIKISYNAKEREKYKIVFDEQRISCCKYYSPNEKIKSKDIVHKDVWLSFEAKLGDYDEVDSWIVKGAETSTSPNKYSYKPDEKDVEVVDGEKVINVGLRLKQKYKFQFDDALISCKHAKDNKAINKEEGVTVGWNLVISAKLKEGEKVSAWKISDVVQKESGQNITDDVLRYTVSNRDVNSEGFIKIDVEIEKLKSVNLKFDSSKILCTKGNVSVQNEAKVYQGEKIVFKPTKTRGERFESWKLNNNISSSKFVFEYTVNVNDAQDGYINVDYTAHPLTPFILKFESPIIKCSVNKEIEVSNGTPVYEGERLKFNANVTAEKIEDWLVKGEKQSDWSGYNYFEYTVQTKDIEEIENKLTLRVSCKLKEKIRLVFESNDMSCKFYYSSQGGAILPNDIISPKKWIRLTAVVPAGKKVKNWRLNGKIVKDNSGWFGAFGTMKLSEDKKIFDYLPSIDEAVLASDGKKEIKITIEFE